MLEESFHFIDQNKSLSKFGSTLQPYLSRTLENNPLTALNTWKNFVNCFWGLYEVSETL